MDIYYGYTKDISLGGICIKLPRHKAVAYPKIKENIKLQVRIPVLDAKKYLEINGQIVWHLQEKENCNIGMQFISNDKGIRTALSRFIDGIRGSQYMGNLKKLFGQRLRSIRLAKGLTQEELAGKAGLHATYIGIIERGKQGASLDTIEKLAQALGVKEEKFFSFVSRKYPIEEKEGLIIDIENTLRKQKTEDIRKILQICRIILSEDKSYSLPMVAEKKAKYGKK